MLKYATMKKRALKFALTANRCKDFGTFLFFYDDTRQERPAPGGDESVTVTKSTGEVTSMTYQVLGHTATIDPPIELDFATGKPIAEGDADAH